MKNILYYFSGTGNTERAVRIIREALISAGQEVEAERIRVGERPRIPPGSADRIIIAFPAYAFLPPSLVRRFIKRLPRGEREGSRVVAAVLAVDGGDGGMAALDASRLLRSRGYEVSFSGRVGYAENWIQGGGVPGDEEEVNRKTASGDGMSREFARKLIAEVREAYKPAPVFFTLGALSALFFLQIGRRFLGKFYIVDSTCNSCRLCEKTCPAGAIIMAKGKRARPFWRLNCQSCNRCMNICPKNAINISIPRIVILTVLIILFSILGIRFVETWLWPRLAVIIPAWLSGVCRFALDLFAVALAHILVAWPIDLFLIRFIQRLPLAERFFAISYSRGFRRYTAPGFVPKARR